MHTILEQLVLDEVELKELRTAGNYDDLPVDPYTTGGYRFRRFGRVRLDGGALVRTADQTFSQGTDVNRYLGGEVREYSPVHDEFLSAPIAASLFPCCATPGCVRPTAATSGAPLCMRRAAAASTARSAWPLSPIT